MRILVIVAASLALAACGGGAAEDETGGEADGIALSTDIAGEQAAPGEAETIDLQASGLVIPPQGGNEALEVPFGSNRAAAETTLAIVLGEVVARGESGECPAGAVETTEYEGLTLNFQDGEFVGWFAEDPYLPPEMRLAVLSSGGIEMVDDSTLGEEFIIGGPEGPVISGLFDGPGDEARVQHLWAGTNCLFR